MNDLEKAILAGANKAEVSYAEITGGHWLSHAPESFIQVVVALELLEEGRGAYIDATHTKLAVDGATKTRGRPKKGKGQRPDISVWYKSRNEIRAFIEVKKAHRAVNVPNSVQIDALKIERILHPRFDKAGYILVYVEASTKRKKLEAEPLQDRFKRWAREIRAKHGAWTFIGCTSGEFIEDWVRAIGLFRYQAS